MPRLRVILVDDQPLILLALERMLRPMRRTWEVVTASDGRSAQARMEAEPFDVLVADLNMPGLGGVELLAWTRRHSPATIRIVLSGQQNKAMIDGATRTAHRFLTKPCAPDDLMATVSQTLALHELPTGGLDFRGAVAAMGQLPASAVTYHKLKVYLEDSDAPAASLRELVLQDPGLAVKALHLVNAAFFGVPRPLVDPGEAAQVLDRAKLANLVAEPADPEREGRFRPLREAHLLQARQALARAQAEGASEAAQNLAYTAALLSAAGPMIAASAFPEHLDVLLAGGAVEGVTAAELSWQYLNLLGLPPVLLDLAGRRRLPSSTPDAALARPFPKDRP